MFIELSFKLNLQLLQYNTAQKKISCKNSINLRFRKKAMAIAIWTPPEYGPVNPQPQPPQPDPNYHQDANNNNIGNRMNQPAQNNQLVSFFTSFVTELLGAFGNRNSGQGNQNQRNEQSIRGRRNAAQNLANIRVEQDNQNLPDIINTRSLPDLLTCQAGMSIRYSSTNQPRLPVAPLSPTSSNTPVSSMDFELEFKLTLGQNPEESDQETELVPATPEQLYRLEGSRLRAIADSFELSRTSRTTPPTTSTFELKIVISLALPTVALLGLGISYLRRS